MHGKGAGHIFSIVQGSRWANETRVHAVVRFVSVDGAGRLHRRALGAIRAWRAAVASNGCVASKVVVGRGEVVPSTHT